MSEKKENKKNSAISNMLHKAVDMGKKAAGGISKGTKSLTAQTKKSLHEQKIKKYNPLFLEDFTKNEFNIPNVIEIVDDAVRRGVEVCDGAIGWTDRINEVEVLHLYDEFVGSSGIQFVPVAKCDGVYCVDPFDRNRFIKSDCAFGKANEEKLAELEYLAYMLGAKSCSVEITESETETTAVEINVSRSDKKDKVNMENKSKIGKNHSGKVVSSFEGSNQPKPPILKWFAHDDSIKSLVDMRCLDGNSIKSKTLELKGSSSATMSKKTACAIDKIMKLKGSLSMEKQAVKEHNSKLIFEIIF